jgi:putative ABC transport system permease protein
MRLFDLDAWVEISETARSRPLRTLLTSFGVAWGSFMLVALLGFGNGLEKGTRQSMGDFATNSVHVWGQRTTLPYAGRPPGRWIEFEDEDIRAIHAIPGIDVIAPRIQLSGYRNGSQVVHGTKVGSYSVMGDIPAYAQIQIFPLVDGRFIDERDMTEGRKVCVVGDQVVKEIFDGANPIGEWVEVQGVFFQVVGWFASKRTGDQADRENGTIHLPYATFRRVFPSMGDGPGWFSLTAMPDMPGSLIETQVKDVLRARHDAAPDDDMAIGSFNTEEEFGKIRRIFTAIRGITWFVGVATLLSGVVGVSNILLITVRERTAEIGMRRAVGATPGAIIASIVQEATVLTAVSGYVGVVSGVVLLQVVGHFVGDEQAMLARPQVDFGVVMLATLVLMLAGIVAGFLPARRAVQVRTVDALRTEVG